MKTNNKIITAVIVLFVLVGFTNMSFVKYNLGGDPKPWVVPDANKNTKNAVASSAESIAAGKTLYTKSCKSCHGVKGLGDGPKSEELETPCGDFTVAEFTAQTDGALFYKVTAGRDDMPSFKKELTDEAKIV